jgi:hypothetical protein
MREQRLKLLAVGATGAQHHDLHFASSKRAAQPPGNLVYDVADRSYIGRVIEIPARYGRDQTGSFRSDNCGSATIMSPPCGTIAAIRTSSGYATISPARVNMKQRGDTLFVQKTR